MACRTLERSQAGKPTEASDRAGIFYNRAAPASQNINSALASGYVPSDADYEFTLGALSGAPNAVANRLVTDQGRKFYNDAQNFMMAVLRPDTGAAFGKEEFQSYARVFIPLPGDDPATVRAKLMRALLRWRRCRERPAAPRNRSRAFWPLRAFRCRPKCRRSSRAAG